MTIIHNTAQAVGKFAVCGTRGWFFDAEADEDKKVLNREVGRLGASLDAAEKIGGEPVVFLHYPPVCGRAVLSGDPFSAAGTEDCPLLLRTHSWCGHPPRLSGGLSRYSLKLISGDSLGFVPLLVG